MLRIPILHRKNKDGSAPQTLEFLVQPLSPKPFIGEPAGRVNGGANQYFVVIHLGAHLIEQRIVSGIESVARIYVENYSDSLLLQNIEASAYEKLQNYIKSCQVQSEEP